MGTSTLETLPSSPRMTTTTTNTVPALASADRGPPTLLLSLKVSHPPSPMSASGSYVHHHTAAHTSVPPRARVTGLWHLPVRWSRSRGEKILKKLDLARSPPPADPVQEEQKQLIASHFGHLGTFLLDPGRARAGKSRVLRHAHPHQHTTFRQSDATPRPQLASGSSQTRNTR